MAVEALLFGAAGLGRPARSVFRHECTLTYREFNLAKASARGDAIADLD